MEITPALLIQLLREAVTDPRGNARRLLGLGLSPQVARIGMALAAVVSVLVLYVGSAMNGLAVSGMPSPVPMVVVQVSAILVTALAVHFIGGRFGGRGRFNDALLLVVWLQIVLVAVQLLQLAVLVVIPPMASVITLAAIALFLWMLTGFVAELHGFTSLARVFAGIIASFLALSVLLAVVLAALFGAPPGA